MQGLLLLGGLLGIVWGLSNWIVTGSDTVLIMGGMSIALVIIVVATLTDWRKGVFFFILWLLFEDLARKYLGNGLILFFGKDVLAAITYLSLWRAKWRGEVAWFKPPFMVPLAMFFSLAFIQVFNTWTPSVLYGFLGLKLYFYYVPLVYAGYAFVRTAADLEQLLIYNVALGLVIALVGIVQSVVGLTFLNPVSARSRARKNWETSPATHRSLTKRFRNRLRYSSAAAGSPPISFSWSYWRWVCKLTSS